MATKTLVFVTTLAYGSCRNSHAHKQELSKCAIVTDLNHEATTNKLAEIVFGTMAPFDLSNVHGVSVLCKKQSEKYVEDLKKFKLWALKMYDSTAKLPSGLLNGNVNQFGDFDLCLKSKEENSDIQGQYCLAEMQVNSTSTSPYVIALHRLIQSHYHFKSQLTDPGHRIPRFSSIYWAFCVPSVCTPYDVELGFKKTLSPITENTDLQFQISVNADMCHTSKSNPKPLSTKIAIAVFASLIATILFATIYDYSVFSEKNAWIMCFSLFKNLNSLVTTKSSPGDIQPIHFIRFFNAVLLLLAHKSMALFFMPYVNRTDMVEIVGKPWTVIGRAASLYTDPFILISGTLTTYSFLGKLKRNGKVNIFEEYVSRLFRILPTLAALIAFCTLVLPWVNSGPLWNQVITHHSHICKKNWWRNLLFVHNYFGFGDMCLTHTHHIGIDTQLFFVSPLLIWILWRWRKKGAYVLTFLAVASTALRFYRAYTLRLSNYIHFGTSTKQLFATADNMYTLPACRLTVYIMGIFLGHILRNSTNISFSKQQLRIGGALAFLSYAISFFGPAFMGSIEYKYKPIDAAMYATFSPILWCVAFMWIIFTGHFGHSGFQKLFSWKLFALWTKISYTVYLVQFPVYFYNVGTIKTAQHYSFLAMHFNFQEFGWVVFYATILTLSVEMPFQNIRNVVFKKKRSSSVEPVHHKTS